MCALFALILTSCSSDSYNPAKCQALLEKINSGEDLTESEDSEVIDQMIAIAKYFDKKKAELGDQAKFQEFLKEPENEEMTKHAFVMGFYLAMHEKDLSPANIEKLKAAQKDMNKVDIE